jgi:predicted ATPase/DNA-binding CsgD family transcriptional regulator
MGVLERETRLPLPLSSFVNRQAETEALRALLTAGTRLVTLTGPGGTGKTRLALEAAAQVSGLFAEGAYFVPLDGLFDPGQVIPAVAKVLEVPESGERSIQEELVQALTGRQVLLILDNFEHLLPAALMVGELLQSCPGLAVIATSREALRLRGEREFPVSPLELPGSREPGEAGWLAGSPAVQLFSDRARAVRPDFTIGSDNAGQVVEICQLLDGLPLAIELAAALMRLFSPLALQARLEGSPGLERRPAAMQLLAGGPRDLPVRQQTLRATIDWSYRQLDAGEQRVFRWLSVFSGGWSLEAAETHCLDGGDSTRPILDYLIPLVDKNLIRSEQREGEPRFSMLRTIREYALEQLERLGDAWQARERHAAYFLDLAERAEIELKGPEQALWLERLEEEQDNLRAALEWSSENGQIETAYRLGGALGRFWVFHGYLSEGRQWLERILSLGNEVPIERKAKVLNSAGALAWAQGDYEISRRFHTECLELRKMIEDEVGIAGSHHNLGIIALFQNDLEEAAAHFHESISLYNEAGDRWGAADGLLQLGSVLRKQEDFESARRYTEQGLEILREIGDTQGVAGSLTLLGAIAFRQGNGEQALDHYSEGKRLFEELGDRWGTAVAAGNLGDIALHQKKNHLAENYFRESLALRRELGDKQGLSDCLEGLACLVVEQQDMERGVRLFSLAEVLRNTAGAARSENDRTRFDEYLARARSRMGEKAFENAWKAGETASLDQVIQSFLDPAARGAGEKSPPSGPQPLNPRLTRREMEVLQLLAQGLSDAGIAAELVISPRTVNAHITSIYSKLGVNSRVAATHFAIAQGLV